MSPPWRFVYKDLKNAMQSKIELMFEKNHFKLHFHGKFLLNSDQETFYFIKIKNSKM